ncbi:MAG: hypothetical protein KJ737_22735 [Proteobacteria bacterium]|nr:hypothetical protein [Pseudomonadota bacterium]
MKSIHLSNQRKIFFGITLFLSLFLMHGCAGDENTADGSTGMGGIAFKIRWPDVNLEEKSSVANRTLTENNCLYGTIRTVVFAIYDKDKNLLVDLEDATFNCSDGEGIVDQVPTGSGIRLVVLANGYNPLTIKEEPFLRGEYGEEITVEADKTTELGTIEAYDFVPNLTDPFQSDRLENDELSFEWTNVAGALTYRIKFTRMSPPGAVPIEFNTSGVSISLDSPDADFFVEDGLYTWSVAAIDAYGNYGADSAARYFTYID